MLYGIGETYRDEFSTYAADGSLSDAGSLPTGVLVTNGTDGASVTVVDSGTGRYKVSASLAGRAVGDVCYVRVSATVGGVAQEARLPAFRVAFAAALGSPVATAADVPAVNAVADALLDRANGIETGVTPRGALRAIAASLVGKLAGADTTAVTIRNAVADSKVRITATVDASGNRSVVTTDLT